ncbi:MAG: hypothetical protein LIP18_07415 [Planctomycetes bacterium]|nr:hypothetical protein [Planctomycetota bacterium]MCD7896738.1 hypothetical protein [Planctomycetaceae bacterium]
MSSHPLKIQREPASLDQAVDRIVARFNERGRIDMGPETIRAALRDRLSHAGFEERSMRLLEVNLLGNISGWMEFALEERRAGRNVVPDFARHLRTSFLAHCREHKTPPDEAIAMSIELATAIMELAGSFRRQLTIGAGGVEGTGQGGDAPVASSDTGGENAGPSGTANASGDDAPVK